MDIWYKHKNQMYITCIDKFSKFLAIIPIKNRQWDTIINALTTLFNKIGKPTKTITDNESALISQKTQEWFENEQIDIHFTSPNHKTGNSDVEIAHRTLNEHIRTFLLRQKLENNELTLLDPVQECVRYYNTTTHSAHKYKPSDVYFGEVNTEIVYENLKQTKKKNLEYHNKSRQSAELDSNWIKNPQPQKLDPRFKKAKNNQKIHPQNMKRLKHTFSDI